MMSVLFRTALARQRTMLLLFGVLAMVLPLLIGLTYRALGGEAGVSELWKLLPPGLRALTRTQAGFVPGLGATGYLAAGYRHPMLLVLLSAPAVAVALAAVAREVERGTIFLLLARPVQRWKLVASGAATMIVVLAVLLGLTLAGFTLGFIAADSLGTLRWGRLLWIMPNALALFLAIGSFSLLLSARSNESGTVIGPAAAITLVLYLLDFVSGIWEPLHGLGYVSLFHYYDPVAVVESGQPPWRDLAVLLSVTAVSLGAAIAVFQRRDIAR